MDAVEMTKLNSVLCPLWLNAKNIKRVFGLKKRTVDMLADGGIIRRKIRNAKMKQPAAAYHAADLYEWMTK